jgi:primosomal protein N' (replication factor Y)
VTVCFVREALAPLTYRVPADLAATVAVGCRVKVPLGKRQVVGYVVAEASAPAEGARDVLDVLDLDPLLTPDQIALAGFAARYYLSPLTEALRLTHPPDLDLEAAHGVAITETGRLALARAGDLLTVPGLEVSDDEARLLGALGNEPTDAAAALRRAPRLAHRDLVALAGRGLITLQAAGYAPRQAPATERTARLGPAADPEAVAAAGRRSPRIAALLAHLAAAGGPVAVEALRAGDPAVSGRLRTLASRGLVVMEARERRRDPFADRPAAPHPEPELNLDQANAVMVLTAALREGGFRPYLLDGVTSSGKTEVYLRVIREALRRGRSAIVLVPEISLTPQLAARFRARFPDGLAVLHSGLTDGQRQDEWRRVRRGEARVVVGARSALFAPVSDLGIIVVDEEHDPSFKQEEGLRYHARDLALVRGQQAGVPVILGSATPSLESGYGVEKGRLTRLRLPRRATPQPLPDVEVVDLRTYQLDAEGILSAPLHQALGETLAAGRQAIMFLNRRGFSPIVLCQACGQPVRCRDCSVSLTYHKRRRLLVCHYCGHERAVPPACPTCSAERLDPLGLGTERVEEVLRERFPAARVGRLDRDTARGSRLQAILDATAAGDLDVLVGTQMVTKGHDFPGVTLVGVIDADRALHLPDFRSAERTFQLLSQVAGRAGRGTEPGRVIIQTHSPEHHAIRCAQAHDHAAFHAAELRFRAELGYPPVGHLVGCRVEGADEAEVVAGAHALAARLRAAAPSDVTVLGPAEAPLARLRGKTRWQILLRSLRRPALHEVARVAVAHRTDGLPRTLRLIVDVDPQSML